MLALTLALGVALFLWQLGKTGLVDETPPLFAAAARAMAETGDWLTPRVNGLPRYDKPPLVYWLMGLGYAIPGQERWNPLGTWAARLPSALATIGVMVSLTFTLLRWPQPSLTPAGPCAPRRPGLTALTAALAFALSPLILLWGRIAVSDALFSGCLAVSLLLFWQCWADPGRPWWPGWLVLGLAVLAKGPVALVLTGMTLLGFGWRQSVLLPLWRRLRPLPGLLLTALVAVPWYGAMLLVEGRPFWDSFFAYHNLQRFSSVVNHHLQPWWYFGPVLVVASLPFTPLLLLGLVRGMGQGARQPAPASLRCFAASWLLTVLLFFTLAATKLPSYWLPATPAAGLLIALAAQDGETGRPRERLVLGFNLLFVAVLASALWLSPRWIPLIQDPEMPTLPAELLASGLVLRAAACWTLAGLVGLALLLPRLRPAGWLFGLQLPLLLFHLLAVLPMWKLGDGVRGQPVRQIAVAVQRERLAGEAVAMIGILKPSLHYYSRQVVLYEGRRPLGLINLSDRLRRERRDGQTPSDPRQQPTVLVVIDATTSEQEFWKTLGARELAREGLYRLWRVDRTRLEQRAKQLEAATLERPNWTDPRPERY